MEILPLFPDETGVSLYGDPALYIGYLVTSLQKIRSY